MSDAPEFHIDPARFHADPYPALARMRATAPIAYVPQLGATLMTRHADIFVNEKKIDVFSSRQPNGLMTRLMGENMMRKDGDAHMAERRAIFPAVSPRTVADVWKAAFVDEATTLLDGLERRGGGDLFHDYAMLLSAHALRHMTGLLNMAPEEMNRTSQGMMDGIANYAGDPAIEANCHDCTASIDAHITDRMRELSKAPDTSILSVQMQAGLSETQIRANVKLAISGGQNEPRDAIAGAVWALLTHPDAHEMAIAGKVPWKQVFEEYARWQSPIGMSPREVRTRHRVHDVTFEEGDRVFLMFSSANRDEAMFDRPEVFDLTRDASRSIAFGAGPHFCAGAWASRCLIAEVALPMLFARLPRLRLDAGKPPVEIAGWAFRGPLSLPCRWD